MSYKQNFGDFGVSGNDNILNFVVGNGNTQKFFRYEITPYGGVVNILPPEEVPNVKTRQSPVRLRPRAFSNLLGREAQVKESIKALSASQPVELYGASGVGKSVLLRYLAHQPVAEDSWLFPDGVVYFQLLPQEPVEDFQQKLFEAFYESDRPFKPSPMRVRHDLHNKKALIVLDNKDLSRQDIEKLWEIAPNCVFLFSSVQRSLWGEGQSVQIGGLSGDAALPLIEQDLKRALTSQERSAAEAICASLNGHPLEILQQIAGVREGTEWLADVAGRLRKHPSSQARVKQLLDALSQPQRSVLIALAAFGGIALAAQQAAAIADVQNAGSILEELQKKKLCKLNLGQIKDSRYSLSANLLEPIERQENLTPYLERAIPFFTRWAQQAAPQDLQKESEAVSHLLNWAVDQNRWNDVLLLGKPFESALAISGKWELQAQVLRWYEQAGERLGNKTAIAWANHQLGTRAFGLGYTSAAQNLLTKALRLREELGDQRGADLTRQLLNFRVPVSPTIPTPPNPTPVPPPSPTFDRWLSSLQQAAVPALIAGLTGVITVTIGGVLINTDPQPNPSPTQTSASASANTSSNSTPPTSSPIPTQDSDISSCIAADVPERLNVHSSPDSRAESIIEKLSPREQATTTKRRQGDFIEISSPFQGWVHRNLTKPCGESFTRVPKSNDSEVVTNPGTQSDSSAQPSDPKTQEQNEQQKQETQRQEAQRRLEEQQRQLEAQRQQVQQQLEEQRQAAANQQRQLEAQQRQLEFQRQFDEQQRRIEAQRQAIEQQASAGSSDFPPAPRSWCLGMQNWSQQAGSMGVNDNGSTSAAMRENGCDSYGISVP